MNDPVGIDLIIGKVTLKRQIGVRRFKCKCCPSETPGPSQKEADSITAKLAKSNNDKGAPLLAPVEDFYVTGWARVCIEGNYFYVCPPCLKEKGL